MNLKTATLFFVTALGCGAGRPPTLSDLTFDPNEIPVGKQSTINGSFSFSDKEGDVQTINLAIKAPSGETQKVAPTPVQGAAGQFSGKLVFAAIVIPPAAGKYGFEVWLQDGSGESNHLEGSVDAK